MSMTSDSPVALLVSLCRRNAERRIRRGEIARILGNGAPTELMALAGRHRVWGLMLKVLLEAAENAAVDSPRVPEIRCQLRRARRRTELLQLERDRVVMALARVDVLPVILKGSALGAMLYADSAERDLQDIDILVRRDEVDRVSEAVAHLGYRAPAEEELRAFQQHHFHLPLTSASSVRLEVHWDLAKPSSVFRLDAAGVHERAIQVSRSGGPTLRIPCAEDMLLHLVLQNVSEGFCRLARLVDVDRIVTGTPELDWGALIERAGHSQLASPTSLTLELCRHVLATEVPARALLDLRPPIVARYHLAKSEPRTSLLTQRFAGDPVAYRWLLFWLVRGTGARTAMFHRVLSPPGREATVRDRSGLTGILVRLVKLTLFELRVLARSAGAPRAGSGMPQTRFWSSQLSSSDRR